MLLNTDANIKLTLLMHYIIWKCTDPTRLGATKLNKVLFYADTFAYLDLGKPITGVTYIKRQFGPVPNPTDFGQARDSLLYDQKIAITKNLYHGMPQVQFVALQRPDISKFTPQEISIVDILVENICDTHTARSISHRSHDLIWEAAEIGEAIPLTTVFASRVSELTEDDIHWAKTEAKRLGLGT